ncbi:uncharacterized protein LOC130624179 [Hydractinia symbiolongicarpus]|uniref:uncharacterized protein LOC130624179 n=1 Tax=Hydractinia symbiolongicarpus TaxID=13093 RepID=UPI0025517562|nr:uncharacterized protein LOC130624179 [Hydractinia symbiolongicarpus]XP_057295729.1 uncharacterized protein LOC130624179 [Hydractinia symbiolongicarpus]
MENPTFRFPVARFYTFSAFFLLADFISAIALWVIKIPSSDTTASITEFSISTSVFELVCISFARCVILIVAYALLENMTVQAGQNGVNNKGKQMFLKMLSFIILLSSFVYITYKDIVVLKKYESNKNIMQHNGYYALCISSFVFSILDILWYIRYLIYLRKLQNRYAVLNDKESGSNDGTKEKKNVNVKRLMSLAKPEFWKLFIGTIGLIGSTGSQMIAPLFFGKVIQAAAVGTMDDLNREILTLFIIYMIGGFASFFRAWLYTLAGQSLVARLRRNLFDHMISQEVAFFDLNRTGELMNRLSSDCQVVQNALSVNISMLVRYVLQILGSVIIMLITSPRLGGVLLAVVPLVAIGAQKYGAYVRDQQKIFQDELAKSASSAEETIGSLRTVRSFSQEPKSSSEYGEAVEESFKAGAKLSLAGGFFNMGMGIMTQGAIVLVLWYGGKLVHDRDMNVGELTAFILYALNVAMAFAFLSSLYGDFMKAVGASVRIFELLDRVPALTPGTVQLSDAKVNISFDDVYFHYPSRPDTSVLKAFSFTMKPGETIALVGPSGGGKSTVINLLERFYDPIDGVVTVGDHSLKDIDTSWFRKRMGIVSQEPILFATTIAKNIAYGRDATQAEIEEAARQANAHDFISTFEEGYETSVGERGIKLSGGQKQRVAIARALLMDPDILLLDEATSALDAESEHLVQEAIDRAMVGRTVLVIAHRLSTVRDASRVIVINKGTIAEQGTHDELIAFDGVYKKLVLRQLEKGSVKDDLDDDDDAIDPSKNPEYERQISNNKI